LFSEPERRGGWSASTGAGLAGFEVTPTGRIGASPEASVLSSTLDECQAKDELPGGDWLWTPLPQAVFTAR